MNRIPDLYLYASHVTPFEIKGFFDTRLDSTQKLIKAIEEPSYVRSLGWNMLTKDKVQVADGESWEVRNGSAKTIRVYRDGAVLARGSLGDDFLGWGPNPEGFLNNPRLNKLAIVEFVYEFVSYYLSFVEITDYKGESMFTARIKGSEGWTEKLYLGDFKLLHEVEEFKHNIFVKEIEKKKAGDLSYQLLIDVFAMFGADASEIPYVKTGKAGSFIDPASFPQI